MLSHDPRDLDPAQWEEERFGQMCMHEEAWTEIIGAVLKLCDQTRRCTWIEVKQLKSLGKKLSQMSIKGN